MDRKYIENEHVVDRYLAGELTVREAREFEQYCRDHPEMLNELPIPVRLKARLSRRPQEDSETGIFKTIPSSVTHAAVQAAEDGFEETDESNRFNGGRVNKIVVIALGVALLASLAGLVFYAMRTGDLEDIHDVHGTSPLLQRQGTVLSSRVRRRSSGEPAERGVHISG